MHSGSPVCSHNSVRGSRLRSPHIGVRPVKNHPARAPTVRTHANDELPTCSTKQASISPPARVHRAEPRLTSRAPPSDAPAGAHSDQETSCVGSYRYTFFRARPRAVHAPRRPLALTALAARVPRLRESRDTLPRGCSDAHAHWDTQSPSQPSHSPTSSAPATQTPLAQARSARARQRQVGAVSTSWRSHDAPVVLRAKSDSPSRLRTTREQSACGFSAPHISISVAETKNNFRIVFIPFPLDVSYTWHLSHRAHNLLIRIAHGNGPTAAQQAVCPLGHKGAEGGNGAGGASRSGQWARSVP